MRRDVPGDTFAARLVLVRHHAGRLSIEQAAAMAGINAEAWRRWEDGSRPRDQIEQATAIAAAHGIDRDWLLFGGPLTPSVGRPTKRSAKRADSHTEYYPIADLGMIPEYGAYPSVAVRPSDLRPKGRTDRSRPVSPAVSGRRAALVR